MKKEESPKRPCKTEDGRRAEYRSDYAKARPNRFLDRMKNGVAAVILDSDVAAVFGSSQVVNAFPRSVITTLPVRMRELAKVA